MSSFLTEGGPAVTLEVGETFEGTVQSITEMDDRDKATGQTRVWPDGNPKKVWVFNMTPTGSDEIQSLWVRSTMVKPIRTAARDAKVANLEGCTLKIQRLEDGQAKGGLNAPKQFRVKVTPGAPKASSFVGGTDEEDPF